MSQDSQPDFPDWVTKIFESGVKCSRCGRRFTLADVNGVGVSRPQVAADYARAPRGRAYANCSKCSMPYCFEIDADLDDILKAVDELFQKLQHDMLDDDDQDVGKHFLPSPNFPSNSTGSGMWAVEDTDRDDEANEDLPTDVPKVPSADDDFEIVPPNLTPAEKRQEAIRRRRKVELKHPPGDKEVQSFLNQLKRTSFKRSSKGFREFMKQMGVDLDASPEE